jgi:hypothetical protein
MAIKYTGSQAGCHEGAVAWAGNYMYSKSWSNRGGNSGGFSRRIGLSTSWHGSRLWSSA